MVLFWRKGFAATSMTDLCDAMDVRSPSLYAAFGSKEALYLEALQHYARRRSPGLGQARRRGDGARERREPSARGTDSLPESKAGPAGCMAMLAAVSDEWPARIAEAVRNIRVEMLGMLRSRLEAGVANGELPTTTDIEALSRFYLGVFQGMAIQARDGAAAAELRGLAAAAMSAWPSAGGISRVIWRESVRYGLSIRRCARGRRKSADAGDFARSDGESKRER